MANDIETCFQAAIGAGKINGAVMCASDTEGNFVYERALGERILLSGEKQSLRLDGVMFIASCTKLITTIAALQCVEGGLLTLHGDLSSIAPELAAKQVITGFSDDGETPLLEPATRPITLEMLLTHISGAAYADFNPLVARWRERFASPQEGELQPVEKASNHPLIFQPGDGWMYGPGLDWAGRVVERVTGCTLGERMQQRIFDPLGITDAQFSPVTREDLRSRLVDLNPDDPKALGLAVLPGSNPNKRTQGDFGGHGLGGMLMLQDVDGWCGERTLNWGGGLTLTWFIDRKNDLCGIGSVQAALPFDNNTVDALKQVFRHDIYRKHASWKRQQQAS